LIERSYYVSYRYQKQDGSFSSGFRIFQTTDDLDTEQGFLRALVMLAEQHCKGNVPLITFLKELHEPYGSEEDFANLQSKC
jgi:hypothetical protein